MKKLNKKEFINLLKDAENKDNIKLWSSWAGYHTKEDMFEGLTYDEYLKEYEIEQDELIYVEDFDLDYIYNEYKDIIDKHNNINGDVIVTSRYGECSITFTFEKNILISLEYETIDNEACSIKYLLEPLNLTKEELKEEPATSESINRLLNKFK